MKTNWDIKPEAFLFVRSLAEQRRITQSEAASDLIVHGAIGRKAGLRMRHGVPVVSGRGVPVTLEAVKAALCDE